MRPRTFVTGFILLFWGMMMFLQIKHAYLPSEQDASSDPSYTRQELSEFLIREDQVDYLIQNEEQQEIGDMQRKLVQKSPEIITEQTINLNISDLAGSVEEQGQLRIKKRSTFDQDGKLQSFEIRFDLTNKELQSIVSSLLPVGNLVISGKRTDGEYRIWIGGKEREANPFGSLFQMSSSFHPMGDLKPPEPGTSQTARVTNPLEQGTIQVEISTSSMPRTILWQDQRIEAHRVNIRSSQDNPDGLEGTAWITKSGAILRQRIKHPLIPFDLRFLRITSLPESERQ